MAIDVVVIRHERPLGISSIQRIVAAEAAAASAGAKATAAETTAAEALALAQSGGGGGSTAGDVIGLAYDSPTDEILLARPGGVTDRSAAGLMDVFMPALLHDYTHGIPIDRLTSRTSPFDRTGTTDQRAKFAAAVDLAAGETIRLPRKSMFMLDLKTPQALPTAGLKLRGHDWTSRIKIYEDSIGAHYVDPVTGQDRQPNDNGYFDMLDVTGGGPIWLEDLGLDGDGAAPRIYEGHIRFLNGLGCGKVTLRRVECLYSRAVAFWLQSPQGFDMEGCRLGLTCRGGFQVRFSRERVRIVGNDFYFTRDDAMNINFNWNAEFGSPAPEMSREVEITGNRFWGAGGARIIGAVQGVIAGNTNRFGSTHCIALGLADDNTIPSGDLFVHGNHCLDMTRAPDPYAHGSDYAVIRIRGTIPQAGGLPAIPGQFDPATGAYIDPEAYLTAPSPVGAPRPAAHRIHVWGNTYARKLAPGSTVRMWESFEAVKGGFADGWASYVLGEDNLRPVGVLIEGAVRDLHVHDNRFETLSTALTVDFLQAPAESASALIERNRFRDCAANIIEHYARSDTPETRQRFVVRENELDLDPKVRHALRAPAKDGSWLSNNTNGATGYLFKSLRPISGWTFEGNRIANVARLMDAPDTHTIRGNILHGEPEALGYSAANKGIGIVPAVGDDWTWVHRASDPHGADFGRDLLVPPISAAAVPAAGRFVTGHYVRNSGADAAIVGWRRLTVGTGAVLGTDWLQITAGAAGGYTTISVDAAASVPAGNGIVVRDVSALTASRNRNLPIEPAGTRKRIIAAQTGGFALDVRYGAGNNTQLGLFSAGITADIISNGTGWDVEALITPTVASTPPTAFVTLSGDTNSAPALTAGETTFLDSAVLTADRIFSLPTPAPAGYIVRLRRPAGVAQNRNVKAGGTSLGLFGAGTEAEFRSDGTTWAIWDAPVAVGPSMIAVTATGNTTVTVPSVAGAVITDTAALGQGRTLTLALAPAGTIAHYRNRTTGGFQRTLLDAGGATLIATSAGAYARLVCTGAAWELLQ